MTNELECLSRSIEEIARVARSFGLDFYEMRFEICPAEILYTFGAYGMPTRFAHWSFGKAFHRMKTSYDYNLSRIYELVVNSDPCYAFLLEGNSLLQNKLVMAHVFAHCDFFKNNAYFQKTNRRMVDSMAVSAQRIAEYEFRYGRKRLEPLIDAVLALQEHIDPYPEKRNNCQRCETVKKSKESEYDDLWSLGEPMALEEAEHPCTRKRPRRPVKDMLKYILGNARGLEDWERDVIAIIREEMYYFWPQIETKIMNEGWASLWHSRIMRALDLNEDESLEFAKMHSGIIQPSKTSINPYYLGLKIWEDLEKRWGTSGTTKIFEVRETESDISFLRNYLTKELVEELDLYLYRKVGHQWQISEKNWEKVRDELVAGHVNGGFPWIEVQDGDYGQNGELYLAHKYEGVELDLRYLEKTLPHVYRLWGRPVHLETVVDTKSVLFSWDGQRSSKKLL